MKMLHFEFKTCCWAKESTEKVSDPTLFASVCSWPLQEQGAALPGADKTPAASLRDNTERWRGQQRYFIHTPVHMHLLVLNFLFFSLCSWLRTSQRCPLSSAVSLWCFTTNTFILYLCPLYLLSSSPFPLLLSSLCRLSSAPVSCLANQSSGISILRGAGEDGRKSGQIHGDAQRLTKAEGIWSPLLIHSRLINEPFCAC